MASDAGRVPLGDIGRAAEDYLRAIYKLVVRGERTSTTLIAAELDVTPPSATSMVSKLARLGLVAREPYGAVELTERGRELALELTRHHRLLELFLVKRLGLPVADAHREADRLEHALSEDVESRIAESLGHPTVDPHGDPIPPHGT